MLSSTIFLPVRLPWADFRTYFFGSLFVAGNLALPQLCHLIPAGGQIFLPIYFFTLVAAYKFGFRVGLITALLSPLANSALFGMPPAVVLPAIMIKSTLLALLAAYVSSATKKLSPIHLLIVVLGYQLGGSLAEWAISQNFGAAAADFTTGLPGMCIQVIGGWLLLKQIARYDVHKTLE